MEKLDKEYWLHMVIVPVRKGRLPVILKQVKQDFVVRKFQKHQSVFDKWKEDTKGQTNKMIEKDMETMKIDRLIKEPTQLALLKDVL